MLATPSGFSAKDQVQSMPHGLRIPKASDFRAIWINLYCGMPPEGCFPEAKQSEHEISVGGLREMKKNRSRFMTRLADLRAYASTPQGLSLQSLSSLSMSSLRRWNRRLRSRNPPMLTHTDISAKMDMERKKRMVQSVSHMLLIFLMKRFFEPSFIR